MELSILCFFSPNFADLSAQKEQEKQQFEAGKQKIIEESIDGEFIINLLDDFNYNLESIQYSGEKRKFDQHGEHVIDGIFKYKITYFRYLTIGKNRFKEEFFKVFN